jgi:hypothetical protein
MLLDTPLRQDWRPLEMLLRHAPMSIAVFDRNMTYLTVSRPAVP